MAEEQPAIASPALATATAPTRGVAGSLRSWKVTQLK